jgi:preprotein translocase subunit SecE
MGWGKGATSRKRHYNKFTNEQLRREIDKLTWPKKEEPAK